MNIDQRQDRLRANWARVQHDVQRAVEKAGRQSDEVQIVGVSKYVDTETTVALWRAGCAQLGESRPQQLWEKATSFPDSAAVQWHLIGHLQRNKVRRTLSCHPIIHSVDSERLLQSIGQHSQDLDQETRVLLEVNISSDQAKTGLSPNELERLASQPPPGVQVVGLMAMAGWGTDMNQARAQFAAVRQLRDRLQQVTGIPLPELSMGMSNDFPAAIAEGATLVRIGSKLFDGLPQGDR